MTLPESQPSWFDSSEVGAPSLNNVTGAMLNVIKACLVTGFNARSVSSIVVSSGVATATAATHGYTATFGKLILIEGSDQALLNGRKQPTAVTTNTFSFAAPGVPDGTYSGTISAKRAPLNWTEAHSGTNKSIFSRGAPEATSMLLRVDDSGSGVASATEARVLMVESAAGIDTYSDPSPTEASLSGGAYLYRGSNNATAKRWALAGCDRFVYFFTPSATSFQGVDVQVHYFGDVMPYRTPDPFGCLFCFGVSANQTSNMRGARLSGSYNDSYVASELVARSYDSATKAQQVFKGGAGSSYIGTATAYSTSTAVVPILNTVHVVPEGFVNGVESIRGEVPGMANPIARGPFYENGAFSVIEGGGGTKFLSVLYMGSSSLRGTLLINLSKEWYP